MCGGPKCIATASNVPTGDSNYQHRAGAFPGNLMQDWGYVHATNVIWDRSKVLEGLPWMEGASCNCWPTWFGGSYWLSQHVVQDSKYSSRQSNFKHKSTSYERQTISNSITWSSSRWGDYLGKGQKLVVRNEIISSDQWYSFKKNLKIPLYSAPRDYRYRKIIQNGALFVTIKILATFVGQNFQVFPWRDLEENILGNQFLGHLNIVPATVFSI